MSWTNKYIGIPFAEHGRDQHGLDCWGLLRFVYDLEKGIILPSYTEEYQSTEDAAELSALINGKMGQWHQVEDPQPFDGILLRLKGQPMHVGLSVDKENFLHVTQGVDVCLERYNSMVWRNRVLGFYRHESQL